MLRCLQMQVLSIMQTLTWRLSLHDRPDVVDNGIKLILLEKTSNLSSHENLVDVFQEAFFLDFIVGEDEGHRLPLHTSHLVQTLDVLKQICGVVRLGDSDLERHGTCTSKLNVAQLQTPAHGCRAVQQQRSRAVQQHYGIWLRLRYWLQSWQDLKSANAAELMHASIAHGTQNLPRTTSQQESWQLSLPAMYAASLDRDCFPDPPTPTSKTDPRSMASSLLILIK